MWTKVAAYSAFFSFMIWFNFPGNTTKDEIVFENSSNFTYLNHCLNMSIQGKYTGETKKKPKSEFPVYTQRSSFLFYNRKYTSKSIKWDLLSMGSVGNIRDILSDKKKSLEILKSNSEKFQKVVPYLPKSWSNSDKNFEDIEDESIYVFKPSKGLGGNGIVFFEGKDFETVVKKSKSQNWVVQQFIEPFLYDGKKNHLRTLTLIVISPNGERKFYMLKQMKMFVTMVPFERSLILDEEFMKTEEAHAMFVSNLQVTERLFLKQEENKNVKFNPWDYLLDASVALGDVFEKFSTEIQEMHSAIYDTIGDLFECSETETSVYNSCFHIVATDVAIDNNGKAFMLEMNTGMGIKHLWKKKEVFEFSEGASCLIDNQDSPVHTSSNCDKWVQL